MLNILILMLLINYKHFKGNFVSTFKPPPKIGVN